jgi:hypothetical protein
MGSHTQVFFMLLSAEISNWQHQRYGLHPSSEGNWGSNTGKMEIH